MKNTRHRRHALVMDVLYGMPYAEAAREYGMTRATVQQAVKYSISIPFGFYGHPPEQVSRTSERALSEGY